ncbi:MAG TPA: sensor domain-containing protein [Candidatus Limnocylindrales bacterium]|nr:sensor domain-containing protein [Candidatus Limnocylindrales bacterium]
MIGAAVLVIGLLLILAGLASARIPGRATFARPGIDRSPGSDAAAGGDTGTGLSAFARRTSNPIRAFMLSPIHPATWYANGAIVVGLFSGILAFGLVVGLVSSGLTVLLAGIGVVLIAFGIEASRVAARVERWRAFVGEPTRPLPHPYRPLRGGIVAVLRAEFLDEARWRDALYVAVNLPLAIIEFAVVAWFWVVALFFITMPVWYDAVAGASLPVGLGPLSSHDAGVVALRTSFGAVLLPVAASLSQLVMALHRGVVTSLLCTSESRELRRQVEVLRQSRSAVLETEASELHRIERDLHDGAQQRLVMLTIDLGLASERVDEDPAAAKQLILDGQEQARQALAEIRDLVRGIAPPILVDRGLGAALGSIVGRGPVPTSLVVGLATGERLPPAAERAGYFVVTEALANVAKHSAASRCEVRCRREGGNLVVEVWDDGAGGARLEPGGGLAGLASRLAGVDGTFSVSSPAGGPTLVRAEIPIAAGADSGPGTGSAPGLGSASGDAL